MIMDKILMQIENDLRPLFDRILELSQTVRPHPSGSGFMELVYNETDLSEELLRRSMEKIKEHLKARPT